MNIQTVLCPFLLSVFALLSTEVAVGEVRLPNALASHMVLQRDAPVRIWGWAEPAEKVSVACGGQEVQTTADKEGRWQAELPAGSEFSGVRTFRNECQRRIPLPNNQARTIPWPSVASYSLQGVTGRPRIADVTDLHRRLPRQ